MRQSRVVPSQRIGNVLLVTLCLVVVADVFFFGRTLGWTIGLFAFLLMGMLSWRYARLLQRGAFLWIPIALAGLAVSMILRMGVMAPLLTVGLLVAWSLMARHGRTANPREWIWRGFLFLLLAWVTFIRDMIRLSDVWGRLPRVKRRNLHILGWVLPVGLSFVFILFFAAANPVLDSWLSHLGHWLGRFEANLSRLIDWINAWLSPERIIFWVLFFLGLWALLRFRCSLFRKNIVQFNSLSGKDDGLKTPAGNKSGERSGVMSLYSPRVAVRCLVLFNIVFLVQSLMDVVYLWGGANLPEGMTHAQYAHRGAYPLIATTLLAAVLVLMTFRPGGRLQQMVIARQLVYLWLAQNLFLTLSAFWRLKIYVGAFDLTRLRVASAIWMGLVFGGVVLIIWRIVRGHSNNWLIWSNAAMTFGVLYLCALVPFDGWIARYNLNHCREMTGEGTRLDVDYLYQLGVAALPTLGAVRTPVFTPEMAGKAEGFQVRLTGRLESQLEDWRGWTWRRASLAKRFPARGGSGQ